MLRSTYKTAFAVVALVAISLTASRAEANYWGGWAGCGYGSGYGSSCCCGDSWGSGVFRGYGWHHGGCGSSCCESYCCTPVVSCCGCGSTCGCGGYASTVWPQRGYSSECGCGGMMSSGMMAPAGAIVPSGTMSTTPTPAGAMPPSTTPTAPTITPPVITPPVSPSDTPTAPVAPTIPKSTTSVEPSLQDSGLITVYVPYEAKVFINGVATKSEGSRRQFVSFGLKPGYTYKYEVKAQIVKDGKIVTDVKTVAVTAGDRAGVAFGFNPTAEDLAGTPSP